MHLLAPLGLFTPPFRIIQRVKPLTFHLPEPGKRKPFRTEPPSIVFYRKYLAPLGLTNCMISGLKGWLKGTRFWVAKTLGWFLLNFETWREFIT